MRRLAAIAVLGLALTSCGSSGHPRSIGKQRTVRLVTPSPTSLRFSAASNRAFARRDVEMLIRNVVLPASARRVPKVPRSAPRWFRDELSGHFPGTEIALRTWVVRAPLNNVVRYFRTHAHPRPRPERGFPKSSTRIGSRPHDDWQFPPVPGRATARWLNVSMLALPSGKTVVTAQAGDQWVHPPPATAVLPRAVRRIDITSRYGAQHPSVRLHVRDRYDVGSLVAWINGLGVAPLVRCAWFGGIFGEPTITLTFRDASGALIGRASVGGMSGSCGGLSLIVNGRKAPPLAVGDFLVRVEQLLNADFSPPLPRDVSSCLRGRGWKVRTTAHGLTVRKLGPPSTLTFRATGKVTITGPRHPAISRCLRSSPRFVYYG